MDFFFQISFSFLIPKHGREISFLIKFFKMEVLMNLVVLLSAEFKNHIFIGLSPCACVCYHHNSKTNYSRNCNFDIVHL